MNKIQAFLADSPTLMADGAMGTMLFEAGLPPGELPQAWNIARPEQVRAMHRAYLDAGSRIILTNSFGSNRFRMARHNLLSRVGELNRAAAALLRAEVDAAGGKALVAGDIGPSGELLAPLGRAKYGEAVEAFAEQAQGLMAGGVDVIWIETMSALQEIQAAIEGVKTVAPDVPILVTMTFEKHGRTMMGVSPEQAVKSLTGWGVCALGGNCGTGPEELLNVLRTMRGFADDLPLIFKPNAGVPELIEGQTRYNAGPATMAECALTAVAAGARIIGACCGSTPAHLRAMADALLPKSMPPS